MSAFGGKADIRQQHEPSERMGKLARHSGRIAYEIDPPLHRHKVDDGPVLRRERFDFLSTFVVGFTEGVLCILGREQDARLGKSDPTPLARW